ncbi:hypothetical protein NDU88_003976 [Pleurodeles waltl]|uniref:Uncharacterized protein n=1 Tax=Pleurodeles waltl TaxID=8319 RepID=A0AAV7LIG0_PLEWA|nr:hypothetical protein NDU88_003976 [Pleurodeles waltl]
MWPALSPPHSGRTGSPRYQCRATRSHKYCRTFSPGLGGRATTSAGRVGSFFREERNALIRQLRDLGSPALARGSAEDGRRAGAFRPSSVADRIVSRPEDVYARPWGVCGVPLRPRGPLERAVGLDRPAAAVGPRICAAGEGRAAVAACAGMAGALSGRIWPAQERAVVAAVRRGAREWVQHPPSGGVENCWAPSCPVVC